MVGDSGLQNYGWNSSAPAPSHAYTLPTIIKLLPSSKRLRILDSGCGNGFIAGKIAEIGHHVIGIDVDEDGIQIAMKTHPNVRFQVCSVYDDLTSVAEEVDVVISAEVIEHLYYPKQFLENMHSVIRPGGWIILTTPYHGYWKNLALSILNYWDKHHTVGWEGGHIKFFSEKTLSKMLRDAGFSAIRFRNVGRLPWLWKSMVSRAQKRND